MNKRFCLVVGLLLMMGTSMVHALSAPVVTISNKVNNSNGVYTASYSKVTGGYWYYISASVEKLNGDIVEYPNLFTVNTTAVVTSNNLVPFDEGFMLPGTVTIKVVVCDPLNVDCSAAGEDTITIVPHTPTSANTSYNDVQSLYLPYFGRPGDRGGIVFYQGRLNTGSQITTIVQNMLAAETSEVGAQPWQSLDGTPLINLYYQRLFNRNVGAAGLAWYQGLLDDGDDQQDDLLGHTIITGLQQELDGTDYVSFMLKLQFANEFTQAMFSNGLVFDAAKITTAQNLLSTVGYISGRGADDSSLIAARVAMNSQINAWIATESTLSPWQAGSHIVKSGYFNGDSYIDYVLIGQTVGGITYDNHVLLGNANGSYDFIVTPTWEMATFQGWSPLNGSVIVADYNNDNLLDFQIVLNGQNQSLFVYYTNSGSAPTSTLTNMPAAPTGLRITPNTPTITTTESNSTGFTVYWNATAGANGYRIFENGVELGWVGGLSHSIVGKGIGNYSYTVAGCALSNSPCGAVSGSATIGIVAPPPEPTIQNVNITVNDDTTGDYVISWDANTLVDSYRVSGQIDFLFDQSGYVNIPTGGTYLFSTAANTISSAMLAGFDQRFMLPGNIRLTVTPCIEGICKNAASADVSLTPMPISGDVNANTVQSIYLAYFGRPGDAEGLAAWVDTLTANSDDAALIIPGMTASEDQAEVNIQSWDELDDNALITLFYQRLFHRVPDAPGLAYYQSVLLATDPDGEMNDLDFQAYTRQLLGLIIMDGLDDAKDGTDYVSYALKMRFANAFTQAMDDAGVIYDLSHLPVVGTMLDTVYATLGADDQSLQAALQTMTVQIADWASNQNTVAPWVEGAHLLLAGDYNGDDFMDYFLQGQTVDGITYDSHVLLGADNNTFSFITTPTNEMLGFAWSEFGGTVSVYDYNGDDQLDYQLTLGDGNSIFVYYGGVGNIPRVNYGRQIDVATDALIHWSSRSHRLKTGYYNDGLVIDYYLEGQEISDNSSGIEMATGQYYPSFVLQDNGEGDFLFTLVDRNDGPFAQTDDWADSSALCIGDYNDDGKNDLQVVEEDVDTSLYVYYQDGSLGSLDVVRATSQGCDDSTLPLPVGENNRERIQALYLLYFGRPGDVDGVDYWAEELDANAGNYNLIIDLFTETSEAAISYADGGRDNSDLIARYFQNLYSHAPDEAELAIYLGRIEAMNGEAKARIFIGLDILNGATGTDRVAVTNKVQMAVAFTDAIEANDLVYGANRIPAAANILANVTDDPATLLAAQQAIDDLVAYWLGDDPFETPWDGDSHTLLASSSGGGTPNYFQLQGNGPDDRDYVLELQAGGTWAFISDTATVAALVAANNWSASVAVLLIDDYNDDSQMDFQVRLNDGSDSRVFVYYADDGSDLYVDVSTADKTTIAKAPKPVIHAIPGINLAADTIGSTAGQFRVNESGAATYSIPIAAVAGTAGVTPEMSLNYSSQGGNGLLGKGWSLGGLSGISRCRQTLSQDGAAKAISWSVEDRFCLDGQRLMVKEGFTYGADGAQYRTEIDSFATITSKGGSNGHPAYFMAERKDGSVSYYGQAPGDSDQNAKQNNAAGATLTWAIRQFIDSAGNAIWYSYTSTDGHRIDEIRYAYGSAEGPGGNKARIAFSYNNRGNNDTTSKVDTISGYVAGYLFETKKRLTAITSYNLNEPVRSYTLNYHTNDETADSLNLTSRMESLQECVGGVCLPATIFNWIAPDQISEETFTSTVFGTPVTIEVTGAVSDIGIGTNASSVIRLDDSGTHIVYDHRLADINGDGMLDVVWQDVKIGEDGGYHDNHFRFAISNGEGFDQPVQFYEDSANSARHKMEIIDYNADGRQDILLLIGDGSLGTETYDNAKIFLSKPQSDDGTWRIMRNDPFAIDIDLGAAIDAIRVLDFNSDGLADLVYRRGSSFYKRILQKKVPAAVPASSEFYAFGDEEPLTGGYVNFSAGPAVGDFNGDGRVDMIMEGGSVFREESSGQFSDTTYDIIMLATDTGFAEYAQGQNSPFADQPVDFDPYGTTDSFIPVDINSDGLPDLLTRRHEDWYFSINTGVGFEPRVAFLHLPEDSGVDEKLQDFHTLQTYDYNQDGYPDVVWHDADQKKLIARLWQPELQQFGVAEINVNPYPTSGERAEAHYFADTNGDGVTDYLSFRKETLTTYLGKGVNKPRFVIGSITNGLGAKTKIAYGALTTGGHYARLNVDAASEPFFYCSKLPVGSQPFSSCAEYYAPNLPEFYSALNSDWQLPDGSARPKDQPVLELMAPMYVVSQISSSAPTGGISATDAVNSTAVSSISYYYGEAKIQAAGRGMLGFQKLTTVDDQTGVQTATTYRQDFPFIGLPLMTEVKSGSGHTLSRAVNHWDSHSWANGSAPDVYQPFIASSVEESYALQENGAAEGDLLSTVTTTTTFDDYNNDGSADTAAYFGNPTEIVVVTNTGSGSEAIRQTTTSTYPTDLWAREKGRLERAVVATYRDGISGDAVTRTSEFAYLTSGTEYAKGNRKGLLYEEIIEPGDPLFTLKTRYTYDAWGNKTTVTQSGTGVDSRISTTAYDNLGRFVVSSNNAYGQTVEQVAQRNALGLPEEVQDINGNTTRIGYGSFGRKYFVTGDDGSFAQTDLALCSGDCPSGAIYYATATQAGGGKSKTWYDVLGRAVRTGAGTFEGGEQGWSYVDTHYDKLGRVLRKSEPHNNTGQLYWTEFYYDILGRVIGTDLPGVTSPTSQAYDVVVSYEGLNTTTYNPLGQTKQETKNVLGELTDVYDAGDSADYSDLGDRGHIAYSYYPDGNLKTVTHLGNENDSFQVAVTMTYDKLGRKKTMNDPDKGFWQYSYNAYGELVSQQDAKGQVTAMAYDKLGRMISRTDTCSAASDNCAAGQTEGSTIWTYNNTSVGEGIGQLESVVDSDSNYIKLIGYDSLGRADRTAISLKDNGDHYEKVTYDQYGRVFQTFDAAGDGNWYSHAVQNEYNNYGYLKAVHNAVVTDDVVETYYRVESMDLRGNVTQSQKSSSGAAVITTTDTYDPVTGRLADRVSQTLLGTIIQDLTYDWDAIGNLKNRRDQGAGKDLDESFNYDGLNRLLTSQVTGGATQIVTYDSLGNIKTKSDVAGGAEYTYGSQANTLLPHAVTSIGAETFAYDANGNMTDDGSRELKYSTFDKPTEIIKGSSHTTSFQYGPDRARYLRTDTNASNETTVTRYIGNVEKITRPDNSVEVKRYLPGGILISVTVNAQGAPSETRHIMFKDHLGSLDVVTDAAGVVLAENGAYSFDAWGQRRSAFTWEQLVGAQLSGFDHSVTTRGFTSHEMLDEVGLIHMNGRIYDPKLGRFLQADPQVQFASDTQSYNRYSYVHNNPLRYTDSSGYGLDFFDAVRIIGTVVLAVVPGGQGFIPAWNAFWSAAQVAHYGGNLGQVATAAFTSYAMAAVGMDMAGGGGFSPMELLGFSAMGGITSVLNGGKFGHGFVSAGVGAYVGGTSLGGTGGTPGQIIGRTLAKAVVGGTLSKMTGGKFANGAATAAFTSIAAEGASAATLKGGGKTYGGRDSYNKATEALNTNAELSDAAGTDKNYKYVDKHYATKQIDGEYVYEALGGSEIDSGVGAALDAHNAANGGGWKHAGGSCAQGYVCSIYRGATASSLKYGMLDRASGFSTLSTQNGVESVLAIMAHEYVHYQTGASHAANPTRMTERFFGRAQERAVNGYRGN